MTGLVRHQVSICQVVGKRWFCWREDGGQRHKGLGAGSQAYLIVGALEFRGRREAWQSELVSEKRILLNEDVEGHTRPENPTVGDWKVNMAQSPCEGAAEGSMGRGHGDKAGERKLTFKCSTYVSGTVLSPLQTFSFSPHNSPHSR